ncbi:hypothetical protein FQN53_003310, partial [Emmonsiellopsis sp. PD_33]
MAARSAPSSSSVSSSQPRDPNPRFASPPRSPSPAHPNNSHQHHQQQHRRGYQACDPCRKRKVRCDLGSVDNPRPPPCVRCRRESKRCEFSATRRKRKASEADDARDNAPDSTLRRDKRMMSADAARLDSTDTTATAADLTPFSVDPDIAASAQRQWPEPPAPVQPSRVPVQPTNANANAQSSFPPPPPVSTTPGGGQYHSQRAPRGPGYVENGRGVAHHHLNGNTTLLQSGQHMMNKTAAELLSPAISNTHDALHLLSEAAGRTEDLNRQQMEYRYAARQSSTSTFTSNGSPMAQVSTPGKSARSASNAQANNRFHQPAGSGTADHQTDGGGPLLSSAKGQEDVEYANAVRAWSRLRFIRAGWFSVDEAMAYISYYYEHLAPLSPIVPPNFSSPSTHVTLLTEEPVLTVTMLTIASRHMPLTGNGANSRAYSIHEKLWSYLRGMIERLFWGQEKFDGGTLPSQMSKFSFAPGHVGASGQLRSLGTIEALLLLTDWHPRALHFPPGDDENTLLDVDPQLLTQIKDSKGVDHDHDLLSGKGQGSSSEGRVAFYKWLEPVWRSDRMSWMLLSTAQALAFELGVFDPKNDLKPSVESSAERTRKRRVRRLILVYVSQSSGRLGIPSMLPLPQWSIHMDPISAEESRMLDPTEDRSIDLMQDCWMDISKIMHTSNEDLFQSKEQTSNLIKSGRYRDQIDRFTPLLREFKLKFDRVSMPAHMRHILTIEYEYTRLYVNCLALQAVVDRWTTMTNDAQNTSGRPSSGTGPGGTAPLRILMEQYQVNEPYIQEVVDASRKILKTVLDGLVPGDSLKHAPVRTFFRILSGMIFILKTFTLGAKEDDVRVSLELQDRTVECLRTCVVDDVHLSVTIADLLHLLTSNIRTRFLRFAPFERAGECSSRERTPQPQQSSSPARQSPHLTDSMQQHDDMRWGHGHALSSNSANFQFDNSSHHSHSHSHAASATPTTTNDPLANIPAQPLNSSNINVSFMPPPASVYYNYYDPATSSLKMDLDDTISPDVINNNNNNSNNHNHNNANGSSSSHAAGAGTAGGGGGGGGGVGGTGAGGMPDWFALPLDQFFNSSTMGVDQGLGGTGPMVGEFDMLEVLLKEQDDGGGSGGGGFLGF